MTQPRKSEARIPGMMEESSETQEDRGAASRNDHESRVEGSGRDVNWGIGRTDRLPDGTI